MDRASEGPGSSLAARVLCHHQAPAGSTFNSGIGIKIEPKPGLLGLIPGLESGSALKEVLPIDESSGRTNSVNGFFLHKICQTEGVFRNF